MVYLYSGILLSNKKELNNAICSNMEGPRVYHIKGSKTEEDKYHLISLICGIYQMIQMSSYMEQKDPQTEKKLTVFMGKSGRI